MALVYHLSIGLWQLIGSLSMGSGNPIDHQPSKLNTKPLMCEMKLRRTIV
ncbi:hypothetical protein [Myxosarcina sp. GI1(2024)]